MFFLIFGHGGWVGGIKGQTHKVKQLPALGVKSKLPKRSIVTTQPEKNNNTCRVFLLAPSVFFTLFGHLVPGGGGWAGAQIKLSSA